ncbi:35654_t:CDS:2 [Racocetra persica]|uniref:35654_t:CDS:1 n=1 Tax=Racocetra persica TaxID=160502 RepID=A0ACA9M2D1_9GLOM|nr:35654_t:CDS:2 [Racocetra persica]
MDLNDSYCNNSPESQDLLQDTFDSNIASSSTGVTSFSLVTRNRKPSVVTLYFPKKNTTDINSPVICVICKNEFSKKTSTGTLCKHLDTQHPGGVRFNTLLAEWIVSDTLLFSTVESKALIALLHFLNATLELLSRETIKSIIQNSFISMRSDVQALFRQIFIDMCILLHPHNGEDIETKLESILATFNITTKIICATTDSGSNVISAIHLLNMHLSMQNFYFYSRCCLAHVLYLIVMAGMTPIKTSIEKVYRFVKAITSSSTITQDFKKIGQLVDEDEVVRKIPQDISTRWNSTYLILSVYTSMPTTIAAIMRHHNNLVYYKLTLQEDSDLQVVTRFLQPFYEVTNILSGSTYVTLGLSIVLIDDIVDVITSYIQDSSSPLFLKTAATQMLEKLNQYIVYIYDKAAFIASVLDPRIKLELMPVNMNTPENRDFFNHIFQDYLMPELNANMVSNTKKLSNSMTYMEQVAQKQRRANVLSSSSPTDELSQYLSKATLPMSINPLEWWKLNSFHFPGMSQMAKDFLAIQAMSVPFEQIFSKAGDTVWAKRVRLSEKSV